MDQVVAVDASLVHLVNELVDAGDTIDWHRPELGDQAPEHVAVQIGRLVIPEDSEQVEGDPGDPGRLVRRSPQLQQPRVVIRVTRVARMEGFWGHRLNLVAL